MAHRGKLLALILSVLAIGAAGLTCSSSKSSTSGSLTACPKNDLEVVFAPMYSAHIDGDGTHIFQVPAIVNGISPSAITWGASDKSMVDLAVDPSTLGTMITVQKSGTVSIVASAGTLCGSSTLTITAATLADWKVGSDRYNNGISLTGRLPGMGGPGMGGQAMGGGTTADGGAAAANQIACTTCHGDQATAGPYKTVSHTPEQTAGFSDEQLQGIFMTGTFPGGAHDPSFDATIVAYPTWQAFHKWDMTADEAKGIIVYLRSLTPQAQNGAANFGGRFDGGMGFDGGRGMGMGGRGMGMGMGGMGMGTGGAGGGGAPDNGTGGSTGTDIDAATD